jgi:hypothetical protein
MSAPPSATATPVSWARALAVGLLLVVGGETVGCEDGPAPTSSASARTETARGPEGARATAEPRPSSSAVLFGRSPPPASAPRDERERVALEVLSGRADAAGLPLAATEPGEKLVPALRDALAPALPSE